MLKNDHNLKPAKIILGKPVISTFVQELDTMDLGAPELVVRFDGTLAEVPNDRYKQLVEKALVG